MTSCPPSSGLGLVVGYASGREPLIRDQWRDGIALVSRQVEETLRGKYPGVQLEARCVSGEQGCAERDLPSVVAVLDVTECNESLALFIGRLQGAGVPCVFVCRTGHEETAKRLGVPDTEVIAYSALDELFLSGSGFRQEVLRAVPEAQIREELVYRFWFPRDTSTIWVVCPRIHEAGEYANRASPDYTYLDNLGDTDALLEVMVFLSQYYPSATIERFSSGDLPDGHTCGNLVVIGGPGVDDGISNDICKEMMECVESRVQYSPDCERMTVPDGADGFRELKAEYRTDGGGLLGLRQDQGYFARFANPLNENATVVLVSGIHTSGVVGAARAFGERTEALRNFLAVVGAGVDASRFECYFNVQVLNGQVKVPVVDPRNVLALGRGHPASVAPPMDGRRAADTSQNRESARVLFIAGDRGGSRHVQLQSPNEYHAIQRALRGCMHRDVIALANPILGATRQRLAEAHRERPTVIHFAGHGNERSLSIVEDEGLLVREVALTQEELGEVLRAVDDRVRLCVLNACESSDTARRLVEAGTVSNAVGWAGKVSDSVAIAFSEALYGALGDGRSIADAVSIANIACGSVQRPLFYPGEEADSPLFVVTEGARI